MSPGGLKIREGQLEAKSQLFFGWPNVVGKMIFIRGGDNFGVLKIGVFKVLK